MELTRRSFLGADDAGAATGLTGCAAGAVGDAPVGGPIEGATSLLTPILLTTLEPTGLLDPLPSTANALDCAAGHGIAFTAETVPLSTLHKKIRHGELTADAAAVPIDRRKLITVVAGRGDIAERSRTAAAVAFGSLERGTRASRDRHRRTRVVHLDPARPEHLRVGWPGHPVRRSIGVAVNPAP